MNVDTGEIKSFDELTDEERASGKWVEATPAALRWFRERQKRRAVLEHNRQVRREQHALISPDTVASRQAAASAKRARKNAKRLATR